MYGTVVEADAYLNDSYWSALASSEKEKYLTRAAELIDALNYKNQKLVSTQTHEFPRTNQTEVPEDIEHAAYYIAHTLSEGFDEEKEAKVNTQVSVGKASRGRLRRSDHIVAGIPSFRAWNFIFKYLRTPTFEVERIS